MNTAPSQGSHIRTLSRTFAPVCFDHKHQSLSEKRLLSLSLSFLLLLSLSWYLCSGTPRESSLTVPPQIRWRETSGDLGTIRVNLGPCFPTSPGAHGCQSSCFHLGPPGPSEPQEDMFYFQPAGAHSLQLPLMSGLHPVEQGRAPKIDLQSLCLALAFSRGTGLALECRECVCVRVDVCLRTLSSLHLEAKPCVATAQQEPGQSQSALGMGRKLERPVLTVGLKIEGEPVFSLGPPGLSSWGVWGGSHSH